MNRALVILVALCGVSTARGQQPPAASDSALVARILLAEDERDASSPALAEGIASADPRIQLLARRAKSRIGDPKFASRDSFPPLAAPPSYADPAWRLRYRALKAGDCVAVPPETPHTFRVVGQSPLRLLGIHANAERVTNYIGRESDAHGYPVFTAGERT